MDSNEKQIKLEVPKKVFIIKIETGLNREDFILDSYSTQYTFYFRYPKGYLKKEGILIDGLMRNSLNAMGDFDSALTYLLQIEIYSLFDEPDFKEVSIPIDIENSRKIELKV